MKRVMTEDENTEPAEELTFEGVRDELQLLADEYECPELVNAYDAVMAAMQAVENHEQQQEMMGKLFMKMRPLIAQAPAFMMNMGMMG